MKRYFSLLKRVIFGWWAVNTEKMPKIDQSITNFDIGQTVNGEKITSYQIGNGPTKILMLAAIHGNEVGTVKLIHLLIDWYKNHANPKFAVYFIPCLNLDGYNLALKNPDYFGGGRIGRFNANKVDLNRNFDVPSFTKNASWTYGKNYGEKTEVFSGECGNSEPETQVLTKFIKTQNIKIIFSFHNAGADIAGNSISPAPKLAKIFSSISGYHYLSPERWQKFGQTGSSYEWCTLNRVALLEIEALARWSSDWARQKPAIETALNEIAKDIKF